MVVFGVMQPGDQTLNVTKDRKFHRRAGSVIAKHRNEAELTQAAFALMIGKSRAKIANMESGRHGIELGEFCLIADELGVSAPALLSEILEGQNRSAHVMSPEIDKIVKSTVKRVKNAQIR